MSLFAVTREAGPAWLDGKGAFDQPGVNEHAAYMATLAEEGVVRFAGPLAGSEAGRIRVLLIAEATDEAEVGRRLAADPWEQAKFVATASIEPWLLLVGSVTSS